jgi:hypothetical protein
MTTEIAKQKQWFDNKILLIVLFFILPPLGIYGMIKHKTDSWKKILYIVPSAIFTLLVIIGIVGAVFIDNYKQGVDYYNKKEYIKAYESLSRVSQDDKNDSDAISKINEIKPIVDSLKIVEENEKIAKENAEKAENEIKNSEKTAKENKEKIMDNPSLAFPKTQQDFLSVLQSTENEYKEQSNELKKSAVKTKRGNLIKNALGNTRNFVEWIGIVRNMETTSKGNAIFEVELEGTGVTIMTMNNEFSDLFGNTLIDQKNPLYNIIAELKKGDKVRVSGEFVESPENDYVYELSMTESGSMKNPDFIVKFNKVIKQ